MNTDLLITFLTAGLSILVGASRILLSEDFIQRRIRQLLGKPPRPKSYTEQMNELTTSLSQASTKVDNILREMADVAKSRQSAVTTLEAQLGDLSHQEAELKKRIESLKQVPIPAAEHFASLVSKGERRAAFRDYALFGAGVLVSTIISIALRFFGI